MNPTFRDVITVIIAGAIGGFLSVAGALAQPEVWHAFGPHSWVRYVMLPLALGGLAGGVAVFVLTHFDSANRVRMFFFAAICGLGFPQVIGSALSLVNGGQAQEALNMAGTDKATRLVALLDADTPSSTQIEAQIEALLAIAPRVSSPAAREVMNDSVQKAIAVIPRLEDSTTAAEQLGGIAVRATAAREYELAASAVATMDSVSSRSSDPKTKDAALAARREVRDILPQEMRSAVVSIASDEIASAHAEPGNDQPGEAENPEEH